ncbi:MAG: hypothetical protein R8M14_01300 [Ghiorsea sp.]
MKYSHTLPLMALLILCFTPHLFASEPSVERLMLLHKISSESTPKVYDVKIIQQSGTTPPLRSLIDVRSNHSDGKHNFQTLIQLAKQRHIQVLAFNEHDRFTIRLGLEPVPWLLGYSLEHPSLYQTGLESFFDDLHQAAKNTDLQLMAGTESTPGYSWSGIPFKNLSLHQAEQHIITLGATKPDQISALPSYTLVFAHGHQVLSLTFWFTFVFILIFTLLHKRKRGVALLLTGSFIAFMSTWLMQTHPNKDQAFIQAAHDQGLLTIWAHPGTLSGVRDGPMGVHLDTPPYNQHIFNQPADAFAAVYGDTDYNTEPGGLWDRHMMDYMRGYIAKPIWAVAAGDFHEEGGANEYLGNFPMDIWAKSSRQQDILEALKRGHAASWHMLQNQNVSVAQLYLKYTDPLSGKPLQLLSGDEASIGADIKLGIGLRELGTPSDINTLQGQWIIDGNISHQITLNTHNNTAAVTTMRLPQGWHVIRFQIPSQHGIRLETNPFLVEVRE